MKSIKKNLIYGESIITEAHITRLMLVPSIAVSTVCCALGLIIKPWPLFPIILLACAGAVLFKWILMQTFILTITNRRVIGQTGLVRLNQMDCALDRIDTVASQCNLLGRIFGYGDVTIKTTTGEYYYRNIANIDAIKRTAMAASQAYKEERLLG